jgi:hypothetical protein
VTTRLSGAAPRHAANASRAVMARKERT